jgi:hypothetical protein
MNCLLRTTSATFLNVHPPQKKNVTKLISFVQLQFRTLFQDVDNDIVMQYVLTPSLRIIVELIESTKIEMEL